MAKKPAEVPLHEQVILEPELEEALKNATDAEMCDIAGQTNTVTTIRVDISSMSCLGCESSSLESALISGSKTGGWNDKKSLI